MDAPPIELNQVYPWQNWILTNQPTNLPLLRTLTQLDAWQRSRSRGSALSQLGAGDRSGSEWGSTGNLLVNDNGEESA